MDHKLVASPPMPPPGTLIPPDITPYRCGNTGIEYVTMLTGAAPGPHVLINALAHGNELCGAIALDRLFRLGIRPLRGRLTLSFANVAAYRTFDPDRPTASRYLDEDFNRLWSAETLDTGRDSIELRRARQLRPVYDQADIILDLHSMTHATAPLILCGRTTRGQDLARRLGAPSWIVSDAGHKAGRRLLDYNGFADPEGRKVALLVECGQHWGELTAEVAFQTCLRLLTRLGMIAPALAAPYLPTVPDPPQRLVEVTEVVTAENDDFCFIADVVGMEIIERQGTLLGYDGDRAVLTPYDRCVLIMPAHKVRKGQTAVRLGRIVAPDPGRTE